MHFCYTCHQIKLRSNYESTNSDYRKLLSGLALRACPSVDWKNKVSKFQRAQNSFSSGLPSVICARQTKKNEKTTFLLTTSTKCKIEICGYVDVHVVESNRRQRNTADGKTKTSKLRRSISILPLNRIMGLSACLYKDWCLKLWNFVYSTHLWTGPQMKSCWRLWPCTSCLVLLSSGPSCVHTWGLQNAGQWPEFCLCLCS